MKWIKEKLNSTIIITGDIDLIDAFPNWILECGENGEYHTMVIDALKLIKKININKVSPLY